LEPGETIATLVVDPVPAAAMKTMAALLDDPTPIHYDAAAVRAAGLGQEPINQGTTNVGYLFQLACQAGGGPGSLRALRARLLGSVFAGDRLRCVAEVLEVDRAAGLVELELSGKVGSRKVLEGRATVAID
jgi:acyl dehydratase